MARRFDVFLSHNSDDKSVVRDLAEKLKARGIKVWLDEWELVAGRPWRVRSVESYRLRAGFLYLVMELPRS